MPPGSGPALADDAEVLGVDHRRPGPRLPQWAGRSLVASVVVGLVVGVGPRLLSSSGGADDATTQRTTTARVPGAELPADLRWPTRGDLAGDTRLISRTKARLVGPVLTDVEQVLWAGHVSGGRAVVVAGHDLSNGMDPAYDIPVVALLLPGGAEPRTGGRVVPVADLSAGAAGLVAWLVPGGRQLLVLGKPAALDAEVSEALTFDQQGTPHRSWTPLHSGSGWALLDLPAAEHPAIAVRLRGGTGFAVVDQVERHVATLPVTGLREPSYRGPDPQAVDAVVSRELATDPLYGWAVRGTLLWSGHVGTHATRAAVVELARSDGATFQVGVLGSPGSGVADLGLRPVSPARSGQPFVLAADETGESGWPAQVAVLDPVGRADVEVVTATGTTTYRGGSQGVVLVPEGLDDPQAGTRAVTLVDAEGRLDVTSAVTRVGAPAYGTGFALVD